MPFALSALADALAANGRHGEAAAQLQAASKAAYEAFISIISIGKGMGDKELAERYFQIDTSVNEIMELGQEISSGMHALKQQNEVLSKDTAATQKQLGVFKTSASQRTK